MSHKNNGERNKYRRQKEKEMRESFTDEDKEKECVRQRLHREN